MSKIAPCLWFDDKAEEAANFYVSVFRELGQDASIGDIEPYFEGGPRPTDMVMTVGFSLAGQEFLALNGGPDFSFSPAISMMVKCEDQAELDGFWDRLGDGGSEVQCGWVTDRFGLSWQVVPNSLDEMMRRGSPEQKARMMQALMGMVKLDIAGLEAAFHGAPAGADMPAA